MIVFSAPIAVDTFFVLSGLLVSFNLFMLRKRYNQDKPEKNSQIELIILFQSIFYIQKWKIEYFPIVFPSIFTSYATFRCNHIVFNVIAALFGKRPRLADLR